MSKMKTYNFSNWQPSCTHQEIHELVSSLESGQILYFPNLVFNISDQEKKTFSPNLVKKDRKNISFNPKSGAIKGCAGPYATQMITLKMMRRFADQAKLLVDTLFPGYESHLIQARTSFRPVEVQGRNNTSFRKDDTLLHVDSFPSTPTKGKRILRFFANVNPNNEPRIWKVGEPYSQVIRRFLPKIKKPFPGSRLLLNRLGITKSYRILYDHYMLQIHNFMKADQTYQQKVDQEVIEFPPFTCWMVFTDQVSHAALSGQYVFEQSFYLPVEGQKNPEKSPLHHMEELFQKRLRH